MWIYKNMIVYLITNLENDKKYVGITTRNIKTRWYEHVKKSKGIISYKESLHYDINKFGKESFKIEIIDKCVDINDLYKLEKKYIKEYDSMKNGYNLNSGGSCYIIRDTIKIKQSIDSIESREVLVYKSDGSFFGKFHSANEASRKTGVDARKVFRVLVGKRRSSNGYFFSYIEIDNFKNRSYVEVYKIDMSGNILNKYDTIKDCSVDNNIDRSYLSKILKGDKFKIKNHYYVNNIDDISKIFTNFEKNK